LYLKSYHMGVYSLNNVTYSVAIKIAILLNICVSLLSIANTYISIYGGGVLLLCIRFIPVFVIMSQIIIPNRSKQLRAPRMYIVWFSVFAFIYIMCFQLIAAKQETTKYIAGIDINIGILQLINIIPVIFISWYMLQLKDIKFNKVLTVVVIIIFTINYLLTLNGLEKDPVAVRILATGIGGEEYSLAGVSGFDITYSAVLLALSILYLILHFNKTKQVVLIGFFVLTLVYVYKCIFNIAVLALLLGICIFVYALVNKTIKLLMIIPISVICVLALDSSIIVNIINSLIDTIDIEHIKSGLGDVAEIIVFGDSPSRPQLRFDKYKLSIDGFIQSPIIGIFVLDSKYELSGHSTMLDILGGCGILGFVPFVMFLYYSYKYSIRYINDNMYKHCIITTYIVFVFISALNPQLASPNVLLTLLVINPIMCSSAEIYIKSTSKRANNNAIDALKKGFASLRPRTVASNQ
jgi:hypothetical protein